MSEKTTVYASMEKRQNKEILAGNLEKITGKDNPMHMQSLKESMAGNAGLDKNGLPCAATNFNYDSNTGEILEVSNHPRNQPSTGVMTIKLNLEGLPVKVMFSGSEPTLEAQKVLYKTLKQYTSYKKEQNEEFMQNPEYKEFIEMYKNKFSKDRRIA